MKTTQPNGTVTEYSYNTDSNVTKVTATKVNGECETLRYLYALDGSLTAAISGSTVDEYTYTANGNLASVTRNKDYQLKFVYDANGKLTAIKEHRCGIYTPEAVTGYFYDAADRLVRVTENGTFGYRFAYLANGSVTSSEVYEDGDLLAEYEYYADGQLKQQTNGAGTVTTYSYDAFKNVTSLTTKATDGTLLYQENNTYNGKQSVISRTVNGKVAELSGVTGTATYTYDALDRLVKEQGSYGTISYTYDSMGNRLTKTQNGVTTSYVYDLCNKLLSETTAGVETTYSYDTLGNLTEKVNSEGTTTYIYDALNQLTEVVNPDGTWQNNTYGASGIRSMIAENGVTTEFMTFNGLVLSSYNKNGEQTEHYYYSNSLLAAEYVGTETELYYYLKNSHGDVAGLIDKQGSLSSAYAYDAFGNLVAENNLSELESTLSVFLYSGEQYDQISGLYYLRARHYDTAAGRFTQEDTYLGDGRNLYSYVHNNPLKYTDPSGHGGREDYDDGNPTDDFIRLEGPGFGASDNYYSIQNGTIAVRQGGGMNPVTALKGMVAGSLAVTATGLLADGVSDALMDIEILMQQQGKTRDKTEEAEERVGVVIGDADAADQILSGEEEKAGTGDGGCPEEEKKESTRRTWQQSEKEVEKENPDYNPQQSFLNGKKVNYGTSGSSRPDFYKEGSSLEVKNYKIMSQNGKNSLINTIVRQAQKRMTDLPLGTIQTVIIDIKGQEVSDDVLKEIVNAVLEKVDVIIKFMR